LQTRSFGGNRSKGEGGTDWSEVYSDPNYLVDHGEGNQVQVIALNFEASITDGKMGLSNETTAIEYFLWDCYLGRWN